MKTPQIRIGSELKAIMDKAQQDIEHVIKRPVTVYFKVKVHEVTTDMLIKLVCDHYNLTWSEIIATQKRPHVVAKHVFMWLAKIYTSNTNNHISSIAGLSDHTGTTHAVELVTNMIQTGDELYINAINTIEKQIIDAK